MIGASVPSELFAGRLALVGFAKAFAPEQEDFGVLHQAIRDSSCNGGVVQDVSPVGERSVGRNECAPVLAVAGGDDLIKQVGSLLIERKVAKLIDKCGAPHLSINVKSSVMWSRCANRP
jgi:hypothetical protein